MQRFQHNLSSHVRLEYFLSSFLSLVCSVFIADLFTDCYKTFASDENHLRIAFVYTVRVHKSRDNIKGLLGLFDKCAVPCTQSGILFSCRKESI